MKSSRTKLEHLSRYLHAESQYHSFNKDAKEEAHYTKGALTSIDYLKKLINFI